MKLRSFCGIYVAIGLVCSAAVASAQVYSNNPGIGDGFNNLGPTNQGQAIGSTGWYYNNVRNVGGVGINTSHPRSGNGSAALVGVGSTYKADIEYLANAVNLGGNFVANGSLGSFSQLSSFGYDWFRLSGSLNPGSQHPALRVLLDADGDLSTTGDRGGLVFERVYNSLGVPVDQWVTDVVSGSTNVWNFGLGVGFAFDIGGNGYAYDDTLAQWQAFLPNAAILGFSSGIGSGWSGNFIGAVDNITWQIGSGPAVVANFEVVPEPGTIGAAIGFGMLALTRLRRKA